jgi:hypothetical protein
MLDHLFLITKIRTDWIETLADCSVCWQMYIKFVFLWGHVGVSGERRIMACNDCQGFPLERTFLSSSTGTNS